jgi:CheY-like chemotaxis protein
MQKVSILIVEDGQSQREMLRDFLLAEGHSVAERKMGKRLLKRF